MKDIHNRKQKLAECGAALPDRLRGTLSAPDVHYRMLQSDAQKFQALFIPTDRQRNIFAKYGEMVQLDATKDKSDAIILGTDQRSASFSTLTSVDVAGSMISLADHIKVPGATLDKHLTFDDHVK